MTDLTFNDFGVELKTVCDLDLELFPAEGHKLSFDGSPKLKAQAAGSAPPVDLPPIMISVNSGPC